MIDQPARTTHAAALLVEYGDRLLLGTVRDMHRVISRRAFRPMHLVGGAVPEAVYNTAVGAIYGVMSQGLRSSGTVLRELATRGVGRPLEQSLGGRLTVSIVNGLIGDELRMLDDPHAITMTIRQSGSDVVPTRFPIQQAFRGAGGHLVIMLHGLCENDESWQRGADKLGSTYASRISEETDGTPVQIRYNTGLHVSENGAHLATLINQLIVAWPAPVTRISLIGHSMGGLVARAAANHATASQHVWPHLVTNVICLGTPHAGAALEKVAHLGSKALKGWPTASPLARILDVRSAGIVDLRHGYISRDEWHGQDLTAQWGLGRIAAAPLTHANYHFVASTLGSLQRSPLGDLLVDYKSATGAVRTGAIVEGSIAQYVPGAHHFALLNHPSVSDCIVGWLNAKNRPAATLPAGTSDVETLEEQ